MAMSTAPAEAQTRPPRAATQRAVDELVPPRGAARLQMHPVAFEADEIQAERNCVGSSRDSGLASPRPMLSSRSSRNSS